MAEVGITMTGTTRTAMQEWERAEIARSSV
jgi:hypothetical protein